MQTRFDAERNRIELLFETGEELQKSLENLERRGLLLIRLEQPLEPGENVTARLAFGDTETSVETRVRQVFRSGVTEHGIALEPRGEVRAPGRMAPAESAPSDDDEDPGPDPDAPRVRSEMTGASIALDIRRMNVSQKMRLASRASRLERQVLLRDSSPQVLMSLLVNPQIDQQEVRELVRSPHAASGVLQHVAKDKRWSNHYEIRLALVKNPKTPTPLAQRLLSTLRKPDLQALAKSSNVREAIKGTALRLYLGKI